MQNYYYNMNNNTNNDTAVAPLVESDLLAQCYAATNFDLNFTNLKPGNNYINHMGDDEQNSRLDESMCSLNQTDGLNSVPSRTQTPSFLLHPPDSETMAVAAANAKRARSSRRGRTKFEKEQVWKFLLSKEFCALKICQDLFVIHILFAQSSNFMYKASPNDLFKFSGLLNDLT
jgi:hypothetical protein